MWKIITVSAGILALYIGIYAVLSSQGSYVPTAFGPRHVKGYSWAPRGFVSGKYGLEWNERLRISFLPLWIIDHRLFHTWDGAYKDIYPVNSALSESMERERESMEASPGAVVDD